MPLPHTFKTHQSLDHRLVSRSECLKDANANRKRWDKLVVGVATFHPVVSRDTPHRILIVQRSATEKFLPGVFEIPGGHAEDSDSTILDAASREVYEETELTVTEFLAETPPFEYSVKKILHPQAGEPVTVTKTTIQLNFVATVADGSSAAPPVKIDPDEHQAYAWVSKDELRDYSMTDGMRNVQANAGQARDWLQ